MNLDNSREYQHSRGTAMPAPEIPKQKINGYTWMFIAFAFLVLLGVIISFVFIADAQSPVLEVPATPAPAPQID